MGHPTRRSVTGHSLPVSQIRYRRLIAYFSDPLQETIACFSDPLQETNCLFLGSVTRGYCLFIGSLHSDNFRTDSTKFSATLSDMPYGIGFKKADESYCHLNLKF